MSLNVTVRVSSCHKDRYREHRHHDRKWNDCGGKDWGRDEHHDWEKKENCHKW